MTLYYVFYDLISVPESGFIGIIVLKLVLLYKRHEPVDSGKMIGCADVPK
jgi:hypothetical protein